MEGTLDAHTYIIIWKTIHSLFNRAPPPTLNTSITLKKQKTTTPKHIANCFTKHFTNTGKHATHKTNRSINSATHKIQGYNNNFYTTIWMMTENNVYIFVIYIVITVNYCKCMLLLYSPLNSYIYGHWILIFK